MPNDRGLYLGLAQQREVRSLAASTRPGFTMGPEGVGVMAGRQTPGPASSSSHFALRGRLSDVPETLWPVPVQDV